jgi:hypothetical protein
MKFRMATATAVTCAFLLATPVAGAVPAAPGESVVGQGKLPGAAELIVGTSGGNDVVAVAENGNPIAFGGGSQNIRNGCLPTGGFADIGSGDYTYTTKNHAYSFTFPAGTTVSQFSLGMSDWGDYLPYGAGPGGVLSASLTAYNGVGQLVDTDTFDIHSTSDLVAHRPSSDFGDLATAGDACSATATQPGKAQFAVSGAGIALVTFGFANRPSMDPHVALSSVAYTLSPPESDLPSSKADCKDGGWRAFHDGDRHFKNQGDCVSYVATGGRNGLGS